MNDFYSQNIITIWAVAVAIEVAMGLLAQVIAERKGHSKRWFWAGFFFSLIGVVWSAGLPDEHLRRQVGRMREEAHTPQESRTEAAGSIAEGGGDGELAAVIAAAAAAMGEREGKRFLLRAFRPAGEGSTAWNRSGRGKPHGPRK